MAEEEEEVIVLFARHYLSKPSRFVPCVKVNMPCGVALRPLEKICSQLRPRNIFAFLGHRRNKRGGRGGGGRNNEFPDSPPSNDRNNGPYEYGEPPR